MGNYRFRIYENGDVIFHSLPRFNNPLDALNEMAQQFKMYQEVRYSTYSKDKEYRFEVGFVNKKEISNVG